MTSFDSLINEIRQVYKEEKLIPFIGSGFSKPLGLPDWNGMVGDIARKVYYEPDLFFLHGSAPQLLDYLKINHKSEWREFIHNLKVNFDSKESNEKRQASKTHQALAELAFKTVYTTNYDRHIENAFQDKGKTPLVLTKLEDFAKPWEKHDCEIIKFHGNIIDENSMILTETQYFDRMALDEAVDQKLRSDLLSNSFLFIGYSFSDTNIRYIWYKINKLKKIQKGDDQFDLRKSYYVTFGNEPIQAKLLQNWDIEVVSLNPENYGESLFQFLEEFKK